MKNLLHDLPLERVYISTLLCGAAPQHVASVERLSAEDCASMEHQRVLRAVYDVAARGESMGTLAVRAELERGDKAAALLDALETIAGVEISGESPAMMAGRLGELAAARRVREHLQRGLAEVDRLHIEGAQEHAREAIGESPDARVVLISLHAAATLAVHAMRANSTRKAALLRTGYGLVDGAVGGVPQKSLIIIGGRTGAGKSTLALGIAIFAAQNGMRTGIISTEDAELLYGARGLAHACRLNSQKLLEPQMGFDDDGEAERGLEALRGIGVPMHFALNRPLRDVMRAMRACANDGCKVVVLDYLQSIRLGLAKGKVTRAELVSDAAQQLKAQAQQLGLTLILLSQLGRPPKDRAHIEPSIYELKETGDLENMAEVILLLWKDGDHEGARQLGKVAKIKWSQRRPRFEMQLDAETGALRQLVHQRDPDPVDQDQQTGKRKWS